MATIGDDLMEAALGRVRAAVAVAGLVPDGIDVADSVRRKHQTSVARTECPAFRLIDGTDTPEGTKGCINRRFKFTVRCFARDDEGFHAGDPLKVAVMAALDEATSYPHDGRIEPGAITPSTEIGDEDPVIFDMEFTFLYSVPQWGLS